MIRLHSSEELINYGVDFSEKRIAVVPFPKYEESQEGYGTFISNRGYGLQVSKAIKDLKATAQFLEVFGYHSEMLRFLYKGIIIKHNKTEPTYTKTSLFLCEKRRFFMGRTEKGGKVF